MKDADIENANAEAPEAPEPLVPVEPATLTPEQLAELKERAAKADEHWDRLLHMSADFENYKKRAAREKHEAARRTNEALLQKLLPVLDGLDMALAAAQEAPKAAAQSLQAGVSMIQQQLRNALKETGLEEVNALGQPFDPHLHEAVSQRETTEVPEGHVLQQVRKGYRAHGHLLRPAAVVVAKQPAA
jgi:molecular chaperone GrpE